MYFPGLESALVATQGEEMPVVPGFWQPEHPETFPSTEPTEAIQPNTSDTQPQKSIDELAYECFLGLWGNGAERKRRLIDVGYDAQAVQKRVNVILKEE